MIQLLLVCATVSLLLLGCSDIRARQERAADFVESAAGQIKGGIEKAKDVKDQLTVAFSGSTKKLKATASDLENRAKRLEDGAGKVADAVEAGQQAVKTGKEGIDEVKGALKN